MDVSLSMFDVLSLYTEIEDGLVKSTRSVIVHQPQVKENNTGGETSIVKPLILVDRISFVLFISIPSFVKPHVLKKFMINSYCFRHFNSPYTKQSDAYKPKGYSIEEESNININVETKVLLEFVDQRNDDLFSSFIKSRKKCDSESDSESDEEEEENELNHMFTGLEKGSTPLIMSHIQKSVVFPNQHQYRLVFHNHHILSHFINRFKREITLQGDSCAFNVDVLSYATPGGNNTPLRPTEKLFKGKASEYIDGQLYIFKDKHDKLSLLFPLSSPVIQYGLLLPSSCDGEKSSACQQMPNNFENMVNAKKAQYRCKTVAYQTLYIDLYERTGKHTIYLVDYTKRQLLEKSQVKQIIQPTAVGMTPTVPTKKRSNSDKPIKNQPGLGLFFKKARLETDTK